MANSFDGPNLCGRCGRPCSCGKNGSVNRIYRLRSFKYRVMACGPVRKTIDHLRHNNMTYISHFKFAFLHGLRCLKASGLLLVHSIFPCWFRSAGGRLVRRMSKDFSEHEEKR